MKTPAGRECPYFYGDYFRGKNHEECRLLPGTSAATRWEPSLCSDCPVPEITAANACDQMVFNAHVERRVLGLKRAVAVEVHCRRCHCDVTDPHIGCGQCLPRIEGFFVAE